MTFKSIAVAVMLAALLPALPAQAANFKSFVSSTNGVDGNTCILTAPCRSFSRALMQTLSGGFVTCLDGDDYGAIITITTSVTIDCSVTKPSYGNFIINAPGISVTIKGGAMFANGASPCIQINQAFGVVVDDVQCVGDQTGILVSTSTATAVTVSHSLFKQNGSGVVLKPVLGGSINATFDHVTITESTGGGIRSDSTSGPVTADVTDSVISNNGGNGINAIVGAFGGTAATQNMVSIEHSVIAKNGAAGVQANGANAAVLLANTLLDQNAAGATSIANGASMATYGSNRIVGSPGSGFNHMVGQQ
jgi:hypothetical protein